MSDIVFKISLHYSARELDEPNTRFRVEQALNLACANLEKYRDSEYIDYKIREVMDLGE
jgi:hypothetical protein